MWFKDFLKQQQSGLEAMANTGVIGLHLVSGPAVGFAIGYGLDYWLGTSPWCKLIFLFVGIAAGFLNVYRDTRALLRKIAAQDAAHRAALQAPSAAAAGTPPHDAQKRADQTPTSRETTGAQRNQPDVSGTQRADAAKPERRTAGAAQPGATGPQVPENAPETGTQRQAADAATDQGGQGATDVPRH